MTSNLSHDDIARLEHVITKVDALTARQEEIIKKVLDGETEIAKKRIGYLKEYSNLYLDMLDNVIARKTSDLNDAFLILERQATKHFAAASSEFEKTIKASEKPSGGGGGGGKPPKTTIIVEQTISDEKLAEIAEKNEKDLTNKLSELTTFFAKDFDAKYRQLTSDFSSQLAERYKTTHANQIESAFSKVEEVQRLIQDNANKKQHKSQEVLAQTNDLRLAQQIDTYALEGESLDLINNATAERFLAKEVLNKHADGDGFISAAGDLAARKEAAKDEVAMLKKLDEERIAYIAKEERAAKIRNNGILSKEESSRIRLNAANEHEEKLKNLKALTAAQAKQNAILEEEKERKAMEQANADAFKSNINTLLHGDSFDDRKKAFEDLKENKQLADAAVKIIGDFAADLNDKIDSIAEYQGFIDTRLQGSSNQQFLGSYWGQLTQDMMSVGALNPYFKQEDFANNIKDLVNRGIAFDLKQRAFLMTIQKKIANTFDVADGTLLRLIRIQQEDSTAGRLGMESALNSFLNSMYETSEYLSTVAVGVRGSLEEMQSLMQGAEAAEVEYQVQKWLGSLYSVGMSQNAVQGISTALGQIAAGQIEGLTSGGAGNLLIMAANDAGLSIADILTDGINASDTNKLLQASVNYLAELADSAKDNKVVQQQLADVFGVRASDLKAATNLVLPGSISSIYGSNLSYNAMLGQLAAMAGTMGNRTSLGEMMSNVFDNSQYTLASSMANNPLSYFIYKLATVVDQVAGGIPVPDILGLGNGVMLNTTISDVMRVAAVGTGILGNIGSLVQGLGNSASGIAMLEQLGIGTGSGLAITPRGEASILDGRLTGGGARTTSESYYVGNASSSDIKSSTVQEVDDAKKQLMIEAKEEEEANQIDAINASVVKIYELLNDVVKGNSSLNVRVESYGLTKAGSSGAGSGAQGGVAAINSANGGNMSSYGNGINSSSVSGNVDLGGWIMV